MARYCNRSNCEHSEDEHMKPEHGGCFGQQPGTGHRCLCGGFVPALEDIKAKPPSVPPLRVVELPEQLQPIRETTAAELDEHVKRRTFDPGRLVGAERNAPTRELDPERIQGHTLIESGMKISIAGKAREMTELHAAGNAIIAETNAEDLAAGVHEMRQKIRTQANEITFLRAELERGGKGARVPLIMMLPPVVFEGSDPGRIAAVLRKSLEELKPA